MLQWSPLPALPTVALPERRHTARPPRPKEETGNVNEYEILLMLDADLPEERQTEIVTRVRELVDRGGGTWVRQEPWGRRKLAYEIQKKTDGVYYLLEFDATPETLEELSRILKITDGVLRHIAVHRVQSKHGPGRPTEDAVQEPEYAAANARSQEEE
jgi:small subunit ribosomal protein S6